MSVAKKKIRALGRFSDEKIEEGTKIIAIYNGIPAYYPSTYTGSVYMKDPNKILKLKPKSPIGPIPK